MPDNDIVPRSIRRRWKRACQLLIEGHEPVLVGALIDKALTEAVRDVQPPSPLALVQAVRDALLANDTAAYEGALREYALKGGGRDLTHDIVSEMEVLHELRRPDLLGWPEAELAREITEGALRRHTARSLCGPEAVASRMAEKGASVGEIANRQRDCLEAGQYGPVATQILRGNAERARTPATQVDRPDIADLLTEEIR